MGETHRQELPFARRFCRLSRTRRFQGCWDLRNTTSYGLLFHIAASWRYAATSYTARIPVLRARCLPYFLDLFVSHVLLPTCLHLRLRTRGSTCLLDPANPKCSKLNHSLGYLSCPLPAPRRSIQPSRPVHRRFFFTILPYRTLLASRVSRSPPTAAPRSLSRRTRLLSPSFLDFWLISRPSHTDVQRDTTVYSGFICYFRLSDRRRQKIIGKSLDTRNWPKDRQSKVNDP